LFFLQAEDGIRERNVTGVQACALPISAGGVRPRMTDHFGGPVETGYFPTNRPKVRSGAQTKPYVRSAVIRNQGACFQVGADASDGQLSQLGTHRRSEEHTSELQSRFDL